MYCCKHVFKHTDCCICLQVKYTYLRCKYCKSCQICYNCSLSLQEKNQLKTCPTCRATHWQMHIKKNTYNNTQIAPVQHEQMEIETRKCNCTCRQVKILWDRFVCIFYYVCFSFVLGLICMLIFTLQKANIFTIFSFGFATSLIIIGCIECNCCCQDCKDYFNTELFNLFCA